MHSTPARSLVHRFRRCLSTSQQAIVAGHIEFVDIRELNADTEIGVELTASATTNYEAQTQVSRDNNSNNVNKFKPSGG
jgi:hypothetical protein